MSRIAQLIIELEVEEESTTEDLSEDLNLQFLLSNFEDLAAREGYSLHDSRIEEVE